MKHITDSVMIHRAFKELPGSEYVASEFAISELMKWVRKLRPRRVLEVGAGIGTLTFSLSSLKKETPFELISVEWNEFCRNAMCENLREQESDYRLITSMDELGNFEPFDLIVIDGGGEDLRFISRLSSRGVIFIEGFMDKKQNLIHETYRGKRNYVWSNFRSKNRSSGVWIFRFEPTKAEQIWFTVNNLVNRIFSAAKLRGLVPASKSQ